MWSSERGDVILSGLLNTVLFLLLTALILYEVGAVVVNAIQLDDVANDASRVAAQMAAAGASEVRLEETVTSYLVAQTGVALEGLERGGGAVTLTVSREPAFLVAEHLPGVPGRFTGRATHSAPIH